MVTLCFPGHVNASFCPHGYGCRSVVMSENQIILDVTDHEVILTLRVLDLLLFLGSNWFMILQGKEMHNVQVCFQIIEEPQVKLIWA